jgi:hypothetical protein
MRQTGEHRGVMYSIPTNDDGVWRWFIYPPQGYGINTLNDLPRPTYTTFDEAANAAKKAIDRVLDEGVLRRGRYRVSALRSHERGELFREPPRHKPLTAN